MRKPIKRRASSCRPAGFPGQLAQGGKQSLTRQVLAAMGLSVVLAGISAPVAVAQEAQEPATSAAVITPKASSALLLDVDRAGDRLVAVGSRGHILYSDDKGESWQQAPVPTRQLLTAVDFVDETHGWAVGHDSLILHSSDAGESWTTQYRDPELEQEADPDGPGLLEKPLMDVWFKDARTGFAVGAYGLFLRTDDGGQSWDDLTYEIDNEDGFHYNAIAEIPETGLFMVGELGMMFRSADFGDTWETIEDLPYDGSLFGVSGTGEPNVVLAWGLRGNMFRSEDFGDTWEDVKLMTPNNGPLQATLSGGDYSEDGKVVVVGAGGIVVTSDDQGRNFTVASRPDRAALATATVLDNGNLLLLGQRGAVKGDSTGMPQNGSAAGSIPAAGTPAVQ